MADHVPDALRRLGFAPISIYSVFVFKKIRQTVVAGLLGFAPLLTGCLSTTRHVAVSKRPDVVMDATLEELIKRVDTQFAAIKTLNASVMLSVSTGGARTAGVVKDYTTLRGYILVRQPEDLRVILMAPVLGTRTLDMVSDGNKFTLLMMIPTTKTRAVTGLDTVTTPSKNPLENLRPGIFFDALLVRSIGSDELVTLTESSRMVEPETRKHEAVVEPDYDVTVLKPRSGKTLERVRVIHINRVDLEPYQQDIYDSKGRVMTTVQYAKYQKFGDLNFPTDILITRPLDEYTLRISVQKLTAGQKMDDDQFELQIPSGVTVETLK